ncbi:hypothetical protein K435DRAFT_856138 [Dendrothele bispora CBS 962.96]|uniref:Uncharacterized protein n=1 Tax=Dendrothele bispora (strain CBS 962.96) TaxID=1314807 RepID=A0A4S8M943_DENBC|nr:hypothetical protein K435DRAFT_856138 [Dendrothele bispora CBS 962.96]
MGKKAGRPPKYHTLEELRAAKSEYNRRYHKKKRSVGLPLVCGRFRGSERAESLPLPPAPPSSPLPPSSPPSSWGLDFSPTELFLDISTPAGIRVRQRFHQAIRRCRQRKAARLGPSTSHSIPSRADSKKMASLSSSASSVSPPKLCQPYRKERRSPVVSRFVCVESDSESHIDAPDGPQRVRESTPDDDCTLPIVSSDLRILSLQSLQLDCVKSDWN